MLKDEVKKAIDEIRPQIQQHGGDVQLVDVKDGVVKVNLTGACTGCPHSQITLQNGIQSHLKQKIPEIQRVEAI